ncbi:unnamed protein product [Soboliphyme baturini]|uniref:Protein kinase domain-containing protein n=1 Tax=Soboliphyme baturini TaxID=241478 RepID=A0A183IEX8_9BILA|nr:unnamed protein product [Soboliphyme baturini]
MPEKRHVCQFVEGGHYHAVNFVIMTLIDRDLDSIRRSLPNKRFSFATVTRIGIQCLEALQDIHQAGFVHRDVKPENVAIGRPPNHRNIYVIDFGLARQYRLNNQLRNERFPAPFRGTLRYASLNAHFRREIGPHDDISSLMFSLKEMLSGSLPWNHLHREMQIIAAKKNFTRESNPDEDWQIFRHMYDVASNKVYRENVDYGWFYEQFHQLNELHNIRDDQLYDWEVNNHTEK